MRLTDPARPTPAPSRRPVVFAVVGMAATALLATPAARGDASSVTYRPAELELAPSAAPPLPPLDVYPIQLVLDDDQAEGTVGVSSGGTAGQFFWFNRFTAATIFHLEEVWVLFPSDPGVPVGAAVEIAVFEDADGDPTNGATLLSSFADTVQVADGSTFSIYPLAAQVDFAAGSDVLIGVIPRFIVSGVTPPNAPAAVDTTASAGRSWIAIWNAAPPAPPSLPGDLLTDVIDNVAPAAAGNWMIRGFGTGPSVLEIPALGVAGLVALAALLGALSILRVRGRDVKAEAGR